MKSLEEQILELQLELANLKRAAGRLKKLEKQLETKKAEVIRLEKLVDKEYQDILNLKHKTWTDLFLDREEEKAEKMEKEKQEYYNAIVQLKNAEKSVKLMEFEIEILGEKAAKLSEKGLLLQKLKFKQKHTVELSVKRETDKELVIKNRLKTVFYKLRRAGNKIQVHLEEVQRSLTQIETWENYNLSDPEKEKIFVEEFKSIEKSIHEQNKEWLKYSFELEKLREFAKDLNPNEQKNVKKILLDGKKLKGNLETFSDKILNHFSVNPNIQNELTQLKAKIVEIQYGIDQTTKLLQIGKHQN